MWSWISRLFDGAEPGPPAAPVGRAIGFEPVPDAVPGTVGAAASGATAGDSLITAEYSRLRDDLRYGATTQAALLTAFIAVVAATYALISSDRWRNVPDLLRLAAALPVHGVIGLYVYSSGGFLLTNRHARVLEAELEERSRTLAGDDHRYLRSLRLQHQLLGPRPVVASFLYLIPLGYLIMILVVIANTLLALWDIKSKFILIIGGVFYSYSLFVLVHSVYSIALNLRSVYGEAMDRLDNETRPTAASTAQSMSHIDKGSIERWFYYAWPRTTQAMIKSCMFVGPQLVLLQAINRLTWWTMLAVVGFDVLVYPCRYMMNDILGFEYDKQCLVGRSTPNLGLRLADVIQDLTSDRRAQYFAMSVIRFLAGTATLSLAFNGGRWGWKGPICAGIFAVVVSLYELLKSRLELASPARFLAFLWALAFGHALRASYLLVFSTGLALNGALLAPPMVFGAAVGLVSSISAWGWTPEAPHPMGVHRRLARRMLEASTLAAKSGRAAMRCLAAIAMCLALIVWIHAFWPSGQVPPPTRPSEFWPIAAAAGFAVVLRRRKLALFTIAGVIATALAWSIPRPHPTEAAVAAIATVLAWLALSVSRSALEL